MKVLALTGMLLGSSLAAQEVEWLGDLDRGTALALESGRPMLVVFR